MIALISKDAGGAEFISRYVKNKKNIASQFLAPQ